MVLFPRKGGLYWLVADIWEVDCAIPVLVEHGTGLLCKRLFHVRLTGTDPDEFDEYRYAVPRKDLFKTQNQALREARKLSARRAQHEKG